MKCDCVTTVACLYATYLALNLLPKNDLVISKLFGVNNTIHNMI